jgi:PhnB protein
MEIAGKASSKSEPEIINLKRPGMKLNPYIQFQGNAAEALNFYATALGWSIEQIQRYGDSPMPSDEDYKQMIMHGRLTSGVNVLMVSDVFKGQTVSTNGNVQLSIDVEKGEDINGIFERMSEGGTVTMPIQDTFWGARFGMLKDKFGVNWMFNQQLVPNTTEEESVF